MAAFPDRFDRADGPLGSDWTVKFGSLQVKDGAAWANNSSLAYCASSSDSGAADHYIVVTAASVATGSCALVVKGDTAGYNFYYVSCGPSSGNLRVACGYRYNGQFYERAHYDYTMPVSGTFTLRAVWSSGVLTAYYDGASACSLNDNDFHAQTLFGMLIPGNLGSIASFDSADTPPASMVVAPDPVWVGGGPVAMTATGSNTSWTMGVPGSSTITVDHGTIDDQWTESATLIHFTLIPAEYVGTLTFTESEYSAEDTVTATLDPDAAGGFGECLLTEDGAGIVNDTGAIKRPGTLLTTSDVVRLAPTMNIPASLDYLITLTRNLYNPAPDWPDGEPAPDVRLDAIWDWLSGGAELVGLPQTPSTSTPVKVDTERTYAFLKAGTNNFTDLSDIVSLLGGSPTVLSHADLKLAIDSIDLSSILARLDDIQPNPLVSLTVLGNLINNLTSGGAYDLQTVLTAISNLNPATAPGLTASTASILGAIGALALEVAGVAAAEGADATASAAAAAGVAGLVATVADIVSDIASILNDLASIKAGLGATTYHPPVWPGRAHVTMGTPQDLQGGLVVAGPMHGVSVHITSTDPGTGFYDYDVDRCWRNIGALSFLTDRGDHEHWQPLGFSSSFYVPKTMVEAASCKLHLGHGPKGTITPWTINE